MKDRALLSSMVALQQVKHDHAMKVFAVMICAECPMRKPECRKSPCDQGKQMIEFITKALFRLTILEN